MVGFCVRRYVALSTRALRKQTCITAAIIARRRVGLPVLGLATLTDVSWDLSSNPGERGTLSGIQVLSREWEAPTPRMFSLKIVVETSQNIPSRAWCSTGVHLALCDDKFRGS
ncbi:hypothetical protein TNCV_43161 [Trichonephila clavipes]|nr:hypothetical protein TNCV_43161 [Trichonephila clavipes]